MIKISNLASEPILLKWKEKEVLKVESLKFVFHRIVMQEITIADPIILKAFTEDEKEVFLNGKCSLVLVPMLAQNVVPINVTKTSGKCLLLQNVILKILLQSCSRKYVFFS